MVRACTGHRLALIAELSKHEGVRFGAAGMDYLDSDSISEEEFNPRYAAAGRPCMVRGATDRWRAADRWKSAQVSGARRDVGCSRPIVSHGRCAPRVCPQQAPKKSQVTLRACTGIGKVVWRCEHSHNGDEVGCCGSRSSRVHLHFPPLVFSCGIIFNRDQ